MMNKKRRYVTDSSTETAGVDLDSSLAGTIDASGLAAGVLPLRESEQETARVGGRGRER